MSILDDVRRKYKSAVIEPASPSSIQTANHRTDKTAKSTYVSYVSTHFKDLNTSDAAVRDSLEILETRSRGEVPSHYTSMTNCRQCGVVPIWEGCAAEVIGCPWCHNRREGWPMPELSS